MSTRVRDCLTDHLGELRHEPTAKRIRAVLGGTTVVDSTDALLVWEPRRVVPSYAVPAAAIRADLTVAADRAPAGDDVGVPLPDVSQRPVLDPSVPFDVHTASGEALTLTVGQHTAAGFRAADPDLAGHVVLDFASFDAWYEEDDLVVAHPRDPYHRIDVLPSRRHVRLELDGQVLADSTRPTLLFEAMLPTRYYLPREDVRVDLTPSPRRTLCAYKGEATYRGVTLPGRHVPDLAWTYDDPRPEVAAVRGRIAFFDERVDVVLDGVRRERPVTPWS